MKRGLIGSAAAILAVASLVGGCAHGNAASSKEAVRVVSNAQDVAGCEKLTQVRLSGTWTKSAGKTELESLARSKGGNVLLLGRRLGKFRRGLPLRRRNGRGREVAPHRTAPAQRGPASETGRSSCRVSSPADSGAGSSPSSPCSETPSSRTGPPGGFRLLEQGQRRARRSPRASASPGPASRCA